MATEQENNKFWTPQFRASFTEFVFSPKREDGKVPKFGLTLLFPKWEKEPMKFIAMRNAAETALVDRFGKKLVKKKGALKRPFLDGDEKLWDGYEDHWYVRVTSKFPPKIICRDGVTPILDETGFYAGCYAHATVNTFCYDIDGNKGVSFGIQNIQFIKDGEPFTGGTSAEEDFDALPELDEEDGAATGDDAPFDD